MASQPTATPAAPDVQAGLPATQVSLSRVGVTGVEKVIRVKADGAENLFYAELRVLRRPQPAAGRRPHVPLRGDRRRGDRRGRARRGLQGRGAGRPRRPEGARAPGRRCGPRSRSPPATRRRSQTPESGKSTQEIYVLYGTAVASERGTRTLTGVQAQGMTACPCAQEMVAGLSPANGSPSEGFGAEEIERSSTSSRSPPTTSAASAPSTSAAPRAARPGSTRRSCCGSSRAR